MTTNTSTSHIDVRSVALRSFRDKVILPLSSRLYMRLAMPNRQDNYQETSAYQLPRLQQMYVFPPTISSTPVDRYHRLLVLTSQRRQRPVAFSLTTPAPAPTPGEAAITDLLRLVSIPGHQLQTSKSPGHMSPLNRAPSFLSGGVPRDRRGRIAYKSHGKGLQPFAGPGDGRDGESEGRRGDETPRSAHYIGVVERERDREFLEALRLISFISCPLPKLIALFIIGVPTRRALPALAGGAWVLVMRMSVGQETRKKRMSL